MGKSLRYDHRHATKRAADKKRGRADVAERPVLGWSPVFGIWIPTDRPHDEDELAVASPEQAGELLDDDQLVHALAGRAELDAGLKTSHPHARLSVLNSRIDRALGALD